MRRLIEKGIYGERMVNIEFAGRYLRIFIKRWARPYKWTQWGFTAFGAGPIGCMFWGKR